MHTRTVQTRKNRPLFYLITAVLVVSFPIIAFAETEAEPVASGTSASVSGFNFVEKNGTWVMQLLDEAGKVYHSVPIPIKKELSLDEAESATQPVTVASKPTPVISKPSLWQGITNFFTGNRPEAAPVSTQAVPLPPPPPPPPAGASASDDCQISLSLNATPDYVLNDENWNGKTPNAEVSGGFKANDKCKGPFSLKLNAGSFTETPNMEFTTPPRIEKTSRTDKSSYSLKENLVLGGHFTEYKHTLSVVDSCGASNEVTVSNCVIDKDNVDDASLSATQKAGTCTLDPKPFVSNGKSAGSKTTSSLRSDFTVEGIIESSLMLKVDPAFNEKMKKERFLSDLPVTPIYDLVMEAVPILQGCVPDTAAPLPFTTAYIAIGKEVLLGGHLTKSERKTNSGQSIYEWELKGWPNGILISEKLERVIKAVQEKDSSLRIGVIIKKPDGTVKERVENPVSFNLCAPLWGDGEHGIISMRGKSAGMNISTLVSSSAEQYRINGFEKINPLKTYARDFTHMADLASHDDTAWSTFLDTFFVSANKRPRQISSCGGTGSQYFFHTARIGTKKDGLMGYAPHGGGIAFIKVREKTPIYEIALHEMGHSFGWLEDEYNSGFDVTPYSANCAAASTRYPSFLKDKFPAEEKLWLRMKNQPKFPYWVPYGDIVSGCGLKRQFRPSVNSVMNKGDLGSDEFNVVSCGYLLRAITGKQVLKPLFEECMNMDGVEKPYSTVVGSASTEPSSFLTQIKNLFEPVVSASNFSGSTLLAAVGAPAVTDDTRTGIDPSRFINVETFSPDGRVIGNEIFESSGDPDNPSWSKVSVETPTTDSSSVDLKANDSDGPLTIKLGDKVTLSWTLPGTATSCTRSWMSGTFEPKKITDTAVVSPSSLSTMYTLSCNDVSGKPVGSDSVEVRIKEPVRSTRVSESVSAEITKSEPTLWQKITGFFTGSGTETTPPVVPVPPPPPTGIGSSDECQISLSLTASPDYVLNGAEWDGKTTNAQVSGNFNANDKCKAPFSLTLRAGNPTEGPNNLTTSPRIEKFPRTDKSSYSLKENLVLGGHFTEYQHTLSVVDSCGASNEVTVSNCAIDKSNVDDESLSATQKAHTCTLDPEKFMSSRTSAGSKTTAGSGAGTPPTVKDITSTSVDFDPDYVKETIRDRKYTPNPKQPFSPLDVLQVKISVKVPGCKPTLAELREFATSFKSTLAATDEKGKEVGWAVGTFSLVEPYTGGNPTFVAKLLLKPYEELVSAISAGRSVMIKIHDGTSGESKSIPLDIPVAMTNCAQTYGSGQHRIVGMYDGGKDGIQGIVSYFDDIRKIGFSEIEPYASNQSYFSYFVDLKKVLEGTTDPITKFGLDAKQAGLRTPTIAIKNNVLTQYLKASSCSDGVYLLKVSSKNNSLPFGVGGVALLGGAVRGALIDTEGAQLVAGSRDSLDVGVIYVHEFSHTFAKLNDEYVYRAQSVNVGIPLRNCSVRPFSDFSANGKLYGSTKYQGCSFQYDSGSKLSSPNARYYRPSNESLMNKKGGEFNVVSCGHILAAIKGGDAKSYFPECAKMDGIIKDGVEKIASIFPSPSSLTAQVGSASAPIAGSSSDKVFLIAESFDPKDPWGEIIEVVPDGADSERIGKIEAATQFIATPSNPFPNTFILSDDFSSSGTRIRLAKSFYKEHPGDVYDFLYFFYDNGAGSGADFLYAQNIRNFLSSNLFLPSFNDTELYGSKGKLLGATLDYATLTNLTRGSLGFIETLSFETFRHEIFHYWGVYLPVSLSDARCDGAHWTGYVGSSLSCGGGPNSKFIEKDNKYYYSYNCAGVPKFHDFELYGMGLMDVEQVKERMVIYDKKKDFGNDLKVKSECKKITAVPDEYITKSYSIQDFIKVLGPSIKQSKNNFDIAFILVKPRGADVSSDEMKALRWWGDKAPVAWYKATEGLSTLNNVVPKNVVSPVISNVKVVKDSSQIMVSWQTDTPAVSAVFLKNKMFPGMSGQLIFRSKLSPPEYLKNHLFVIDAADDSNIKHFGTKDFEIETVISVDEDLNIANESGTSNSVSVPDVVATLQVLSPKAGDIFNAGSLMTVKWTGGVLPPDAPVRISLWRGRVTTTPKTNKLIQGITTPNDGNEEWVIPSNLSPSFYFIEVSCADPIAPCVSGASSAFRVVGLVNSFYMSADLKVDGSDKPPAMKRGTAFTLSFDVSGVATCYPSWPGSDVIWASGKTELVFDSATPKVYEMVCYDSKNSQAVSDSVVITPI